MTAPKIRFTAKIVDGATRAPIGAASVLVNGVEISSDSAGAWSLDVRAGRASVRVNAEGYVPFAQDFAVGSVALAHTIKLVKKGTPVIVSAAGASVEAGPVVLNFSTGAYESSTPVSATWISYKHAGSMPGTPLVQQPNGTRHRIIGVLHVEALKEPRRPVSVVVPIPHNLPAARLVLYSSGAAGDWTSSIVPSSVLADSATFAVSHFSDEALAIDDTTPVYEDGETAAIPVDENAGTLLIAPESAGVILEQPEGDALLASWQSQDGTRIALVEGAVVPYGVTVSTGDIRGAIRFYAYDGSIVELGPNSSMRNAEDASPTSLIKLLYGYLRRMVTPKPGPHPPTDVLRTPSGVVGVRGTIFSASVAPCSRSDSMASGAAGNEEQIEVDEGAVDYSYADGSRSAVTVNAFGSLTVGHCDSASDAGGPPISTAGGLSCSYEPIGPSCPCGPETGPGTRTCCPLTTPYFCPFTGSCYFSADLACVACFQGQVPICYYVFGPVTGSGAAGTGGAGIAGASGAGTGAAGATDTGGAGTGGTSMIGSGAAGNTGATDGGPSDTPPPFSASDLTFTLAGSFYNNRLSTIMDTQSLTIVNRTAHVLWLAGRPFSILNPPPENAGTGFPPAVGVSVGETTLTAQLRADAFGVVADGTYGDLTVEVLNRLVRLDPPTDTAGYLRYSLTIKDLSVCDPSQGLPLVRIRPSRLSAPIGTTITFTPVVDFCGTTPIASWCWDFGDGTIVPGSSTESVSHAFSAGANVCLSPKPPQAADCVARKPGAYCPFPIGIQMTPR